MALVYFSFLLSFSIIFNRFYFINFINCLLVAIRRT
jgi:hypothetical protein